MIRAVAERDRRGGGRASAAALVLVATLALAAEARAQTAPAPPPAYGVTTYSQPGSATVIVAPQPAPAMPAPRLVSEERSASIRGLWLPGLIVLPVAWISTWSTATSELEGDGATYSWIPVVGPWLMLTTDLGGSEALAVVSGIAQGAAAIMLVLGLSLRRTWTETYYVVDPPGGGAPIRLSWSASPIREGGVGSATLRF